MVRVWVESGLAALERSSHRVDIRELRMKKPSLCDRAEIRVSKNEASKLKFPTILLAAISMSCGGPASAQSEQLDFGPHFETVLIVARLIADCAYRRVTSTADDQRPCVVPGNPRQKLQNEIDTARWFGTDGNQYVEGYEEGLAHYLLEQKIRSRIDPNFSVEDRGRAELALNILDGYWNCLDRQIRSADETQLAAQSAFDDLMKVAVENCSEHRIRAMMRIAPDAPDFAGFDPIRDGSLPEAGVAEVLHAIQRFAIAYNAGLRGYRQSHAIELIVLPAPISARP